MIAITTTPLILTVILPAVMICGAGYLARRARGMPVPKNAVSWAIMIFAVVFSSVCGVVGFVIYNGQQRDYTDCVYGVNRSFGSRDYNEHLINVIAANIPDRPDIVNDLRTELDADLPMRSLTECDALKP